MLYFFYFLIAELFLCGSGQIIHVYGGLTLRMFNFIIAIFISIYFLLRKPLMGKDTTRLFLFYVFSFLIGISLSLVGESTKHLFEDIKPLSFFFIFPFFYWMIKSGQVIMNIIRVLKYGVIIMTVVYLIYLLLIRFFGVIDFYSLYYGGISEESDFMFRGTGGELFYKGFVFLPIGLVFLLQSKKYILSVFVLIAIYFTLTRGFYVIAFLAVLMSYVFFSSKANGSKVFVILIVSIICLLLCSYFSLFDMGEGRESGDQLRVLTIEQVVDRITPFSFLFGHGFGNGVPIREVHMEMSYLEIFHKQGIIGLSFWTYLLYSICRYYKQVVGKYRRIAGAFFISASLIYVQSLFNPYLNNPIGMSTVLLAYFSCRRLSLLSQE
nr:hypothetical protein [Bacteroides intestinalis]